MQAQSPYFQPPTPGSEFAKESDPTRVSAIDAVKFALEGPDWKMNLLFGVVFQLIPIVGPIALAGWFCEIHQRLVRKHDKPVPKLDFSDLVFYLTRGLVPFLVGLVVTLPMIFLIYGFIIAAAVAAGVLTRSTGEPLVGLLVALGISVVGLLFGLFMSVITNAVQTRAELTEDFGKAISPGPMFAYAKATWKRVLVKNFTFGFIVIGLIILGIVACYLGLYPAIVVIQIAALNLRYQVYNEYLAKGGEPIELKAVQALPSEAAPVVGPPPGGGYGY